MEERLANAYIFSSSKSSELSIMEFILFNNSNGVPTLRIN